MTHIPRPFNLKSQTSRKILIMLPTSIFHHSLLLLKNLSSFLHVLFPEKFFHGHSLVMTSCGQIFIFEKFTGSSTCLQNFSFLRLSTKDLDRGANLPPTQNRAKQASYE